MAYIVNKTITDTVNAASVTVDLGAHQTDDLLVVLLTNDVGGTTITTASSGWSILVQERAGANVRSAVAYKVATSGSETSPVFSGATDDWMASCFVVRDADPTNPFGATPTDGTDYNSTVYTAATSWTTGGITTAVDECLILNFMGIDGSANAAYRAKCPIDSYRPALVNPSANVNQFVGLYQQETAGAVPTTTFYSANSLVAGNIVIAIRNKTGGALQPDLRTDIDELRYYGALGASYDATTTWEAPNQFAATINSISASSTAPTTSTVGTSAIDEANYSTFTTLASAQNTTGHWVGGTHTITSTDMTNKIFAVTMNSSFNSDSSLSGAEGWIIGFSDGTNWVTYQVTSKKTKWGTNIPITPFISLGSATVYASSGTINWAAITRIGYFQHRIGSSTTSVSLMVKNATIFNGMSLTGGGASYPATPIHIQELLTGWGGYKWVQLQGVAQVLVKSPTTIGDGGANTTYFSNEAASLELPPAYSELTSEGYLWNVDPNQIALTVDAGASDTLNVASGVMSTDTQQALTVDAGSSTSATYSFAQSFVGWLPTLKTGVNVVGATFAQCGEIDAKGTDLTDCTIKSTTSTDAAIAFSEDGGSMTRCTVDISSTSADYHIELGTAVTGVTLTDVTFTGTPGVDKVHVKKTTGTVTITISGTTSLVAGDVTSDGATVVIDAPAIERGLEFTGLIAGSQVKVYTTGTTTELFSDNSSSTTETWDDATTGSITVDYVIQKSGYLPIRVVGVTVTGAETGGIQTVPVSQVIDNAYNASHGLTYTTDFAYNPTTRVLTIVAAQQGRNLYSALIDAFIAESSLANTEFPILAIGIDRFDFTSDGTTAATIDSGDIQFWRGAGMEWEHATTGNKTRKYCSIVGTGTNASGTKGYYQQVDGASPTALSLVSNNVNQVIQYYSDPNGDGSTADGYNRSGHLVVKLFNDGYYQASQDVLVAYGIAALESYEYVLNLQMESTGLGTGDRGITITVTDDTASPVEQQTGYFFDYKIEGGASDTPEDLLRQWIYDVFTDPTASDYASKVNFNWPDPIIEVGGNYETRRGIVYGEGATTDLHGFYVEEGSGYHPDFTRQQSNDGTYFVTPILATASVTGMPTAGAVIRLQIINETGRTASAWQATTAYVVGDKVRRTSGIGTESNAGLYFVCTTAGTTGGTEPTWDTTPGNTTADGTAVWTTRAVQKYSNNPSSSSYSATYTEGTEYSSGDTVRVRFAEMNGATSFKTFSQNVVASASGWAVVCDEEADTVYADNAVNGTTITKFTADYVANELNLVVASNFTSAELYAFYCFALTSADGIHDFWGGLTAIDAGNYRINTDIIDGYFDNETTATQRQTDTARIFRDDGAYPVKDPTTSGFGIDVNWMNQVLVQIVSGASVVTAQDIEDIANAVWEETEASHTTAGTTGKALTTAKNKAALAASLSA